MNHSTHTDFFRYLTKLQVFLVFFTLLVLQINCSRSTVPGQGGLKERQDRPGLGRTAKPEEAAVPVAVELSVLGDISSYYTATATLAAEKEAVVQARVSGIVVSLGCEEGDLVKKDQPLVVIGDEEYRLRLQQAEANVVDLRSRFARSQQLKEQKMISVEEFERVQNSLLAAEAEEGLARLMLSYTVVTAPFEGVVVTRHVALGQNVSIGTELFNLADFKPLLAKVYVPAKEFRKLVHDQPVEIILESNQQHLQGRITLISPIIDPSSGTIKITVEIHDYPTGVRPGDFTEVRIMTERRTERVLAPAIALISERGEDLVYVVKDGKAETRSVETGFIDQERVEIISGLSASEQVIVKGQRLLKHGVPVKVVEGGPEILLTEDTEENVGAAPDQSAVKDGQATNPHRESRRPKTQRRAG